MGPAANLRRLKRRRHRASPLPQAPAGFRPPTNKRPCIGQHLGPGEFRQHGHKRRICPGVAAPQGDARYPPVAQRFRVGDQGLPIDPLTTDPEPTWSPVGYQMQGLHAGMPLQQRADRLEWLGFSSQGLNRLECRRQQGGNGWAEPIGQDQLGLLR